MPRGRRGSQEPGPCSRGGRSRPPHRPGAGRRGAPARAPHPSSTPARRRARDGGARRGRERRAPGDGPCRVYPTTRRMSDPRADFLARSERGGIVPVLREVVLDGDTPLAAFVKVARPPFGFLLESVVGGERWRSEEHTSELQSRGHLVCRLLLEKKKAKPPDNPAPQCRLKMATSPA